MYCLYRPELCFAPMQVLNEEEQIVETVQAIRSLEPPAHEIIVVDGGSQDRYGKVCDWRSLKCD